MLRKYINLFFKKILGDRFEEVRAYYWDLRYSNNSSQNLIIYSQGRSGSTLLNNLLKSTGYFDSYNEILDHDKKQVAFPYRYINGYSKIAKNNFLFNLKIQNLNSALRKGDTPNKFLSKLSQKGWKIIWLERSSKLDQTLSNFLAEDSSQYHYTSGKKRKLRIKIDCNSFNKRIKRYENLRGQEIRSLHNIPYIYINYEKDLLLADRHQATVNKILQHLSLPSKEVYSVYKKINTFEQEDIIINYPEFEEKVLNSLKV
ncbi:hypothetical protein [Salinimicrobium gaetbulicola]|uniref:Sulfotransferase family protein n=1 Tax=Salinimicrobium gaetbulicola TaxID=999702 RepID=A0ABW3IIY0_9FLAO